MKTHYTGVLNLCDGVTLGAYHSYEEGYKWNGNPSWRLEIAQPDGTISTKTIDADAIEELYFNLGDMRSIISHMPLPSKVI